MSARRPDRMPAIASVMTPFPWYVESDAPLARARELMAEHEIRHLPVKRGGALAGIVSAREIELVESGAADRRSELTVGDACASDAFVVELSARLDRVLLEMAERHLDAALVVRGGKLAGIFTVTDACRGFGEFLEATFPDPEGGDAA
jgi:acetoin utilization protein AcuB